MDRDDAWPTGSSELLALAKELNDRVTALRERLRVAELENEKFQQIIARLKRMQFGRSSERHAGQFVLDLVADAVAAERARPARAGAAGPGSGVQVSGPHALVPAGPHLCPRRGRYRSRHHGGLGW